MRRNKSKKEGKKEKSASSPSASPRGKGGSKSPGGGGPKSLRDTHVVHGDGEEISLPWTMDLDAEDFFVAAQERLMELGGMTSDGIFRVAGSNETVGGMKVDMEGGKPAKDVLGAVDDVNDLSTCLGRWLREQPMMVPPGMFASCDELVSADGDAEACEGFMAELPEPGQTLLRMLLGMLQRVDSHATRMTPDNLSRVFALTVIKRDDPMEMAQHVTGDAAFVSLLIQRLPVPPGDDDEVEGEGAEEDEEEEGEPVMGGGGVTAAVPLKARSPTRSLSRSPSLDRTPSKIAKEESTRLAELERMLDDPELKDAGMNKGGKRQTLVRDSIQHSGKETRPRNPSMCLCVYGSISEREVYCPPVS